MRYNTDEDNNPLVGKTITKVFLADDGGAIRFDLGDGTSIMARADGDCCSHTWIEEVQGLDQLLNSPVVSVDDVGDMPEKTGNSYNHDEEEMQYYGCKITTEKGYALIDYRNSSNGYYGGNLAWMDDHFYGGVYGQNISKENWQEVKE